MDTFIFKGVGLFWVVIGAWIFLGAFRKSAPAVVEAEPETESSSASKTTRKKKLGWTWLYGLFWFFLGIATLNGSFTADMAAFFVPAFGLFTAGCGAWSFLSTFRGTGQVGEGMDPTNKVPPDSQTKPYDPPGQRRVIGVFTIILGCAAVWFSGLSLGLAPVAVSQPPEIDNSLAGIVTHAVERELEQQGRIGMVVGAVAKDEETLLGFGSLRLGRSQPPDADTVFEIGSISKVFTGTLLAKKVETGELGLDDRVADLLPEGWSLSEAAGAITLRHLTTHTSGFPRLPGNLLGLTSVFKNLFGGDPYRDYTEEQFRKALSTVDLEFEPGTDRLYSNFAVGLLGFVLATHNGSDYETLLKSELCDPLGMDRTVITNEDWHLEHFATGYRTTLKVGPGMLALGSSQWLLPNHLAGAGAIRSTGSDMLKFLKAHMGLVSTPLDAAIQLSHQEIYRENDFRAMGMNWIRDFEGDLSQNVLWHNGGTGGYRSYLGFTEDRRFGVVVLSNTSLSVDGLGDRILKTLVRNNSDLKPVTKAGYAKVAPYTGVRWKNDRPIVRVEGRWSPLVSIDGLPIEDILEFAQKEFGERARKRFGEDLVELLSKMGHDPDWEVTLGLVGEDGEVEEREIPMTEEKRALARE